MSTAMVQTPAINPRYACFLLSVRESRIHSRGVYAEELIPARRKVIEYTGQKINRRESRRRGDVGLTYLFTLDLYWTIDGAVGGSGAEMINHSCEPNLHTWYCKRNILYMSLRTIHPGEELTVDYRFDKNAELVPCSCGASSCRGTINLR